MKTCFFVLVYLFPPMRAFKYAYETPTKLVWTDAHPNPEAKALGKDEVVATPIAVSLNPVDYKVPDIPHFAKVRKDTPVGIDFAGRVVAVGAKVTHFKVGDLVFGASEGALAEKIVAKEKRIAKFDDVKMAEQLCCLPVAALTAWQGLQQGGCLNAKTPKKILVLGASGGVGHFAVQLAKKTNPVGSKVVAVTSTKNVTFVKSLGADEVLDYTEIGFDLAASVTEADLVFDCVSPDFEYEPIARKCLKKKTGVYVAANSSRTSDWIRSGLSASLPFNVQRGNYKLIMVDVTTADLQAVGELAQQGKLKANIQRQVAFNEDALRGALDLLKSHRTVGKIVVSNF